MNNNNQKEIIISISDDGFVYDDNNYCGYTIVTNKRTIRIGVEDGQCCCEQYGYICSEDDTSQYIQSELLSVNVVDQALKKYYDISEYEGNAVFVDFETTNGLFQLVVYNNHNGYYGHRAIVVSDQKELYRDII